MMCGKSSPSGHNIIVETIKVELVYNTNPVQFAIRTPSHILLANIQFHIAYYTSLLTINIHSFFEYYTIILIKSYLPEWVTFLKQSLHCSSSSFHYVNFLYFLLVAVFFLQSFIRHYIYKHQSHFSHILNTKLLLSQDRQ